MKQIAVIGSINMDIVNSVLEFPKPGETIHGKGTKYFSGGKGANQAVAAAKAGGHVAMAGAVGTDAFGSVLKAELAQHGVSVEYVMDKQGTSGLAFITVNEPGENTIILSAGSNGAYLPEDVPAQLLKEAEFALMQNEIPWETTWSVMKACRSHGTRVLYNPAPARKLPEECLAYIDTLVMNETEAEVITGRKVDGEEQALAASEALLSAGVQKLIITLGERGSVYTDHEGNRIVTPAFKVRPEDTTAAGDTFIGAYAAAICGGEAPKEALRFASAAAAITVTRTGAQSSIPAKSEIEDFLS